MENIYEGSCHCGAVRFWVTTDRKKVVVCNCSICRKKGARYLRVSPEEFQVVSGEGHLQTYQFGTKVAHHFFCPTCGIHPFGRPRSAPEMININIQCLDNVDPDNAGFEFVHFDGQHWEQAVAELNLQMNSLTSKVTD